MLLSDFDDVDKYLVDADRLFTNVADFKSLQDDFSYLSERQREAILHFVGNFRSDGTLTVDLDAEQPGVKERFLRIWNLLSPEDQAVVTEELTAGGKEFTAMCAASNEEYMKAFEEAGVTIVVPSEADKEAFAAAAAEAAVTLGLREGVMDEIKAAAN